METSENEFKKLSIIRSQIDRLREYWGPVEDKRLVRDFLPKEEPKLSPQDLLKQKLKGIKKGG